MTQGTESARVEQVDRTLFVRPFGVIATSSPIDQRALRDIARHRLAAIEATTEAAASSRP
ncbi:hypothetical protein [Sphingomonas sp. KC8]|uniref:hypothetical protein n=1 Tax=Sphingomonas sp. KC8 TaxID=1030157 RepID=UPI0003134A90|nr:hypothetical protein [Sphingomonas sp. KC8]ARS27644.1 hypothetical protein KC8_10100 [Sphingomonas sp. KC8]